MHLVTYPNPVLRARAVPVRNVGKNERRMLRQMLKHMRGWKGVGLAAPQAGRLEQLIVAELGDRTVLWANPTILEQSGTQQMEEGCLSIPGTFVEINRAACVWVRAIDEDNKEVERRLEGLLARVVQHEIDHSRGRLIVDYGQPVMRQDAVSKCGKVP